MLNSVYSEEFILAKRSDYTNTIINKILEHKSYFEPLLPNDIWHRLETNRIVYCYDYLTNDISRLYYFSTQNYRNRTLQRLTDKLEKISRDLNLNITEKSVLQLALHAELEADLKTLFSFILTSNENRIYTIISLLLATSIEEIKNALHENSKLKANKLLSDFYFLEMKLSDYLRLNEESSLEEFIEI